MKGKHQAKRFLERLSNFRPNFEIVSRHLAVYSLALTLSDEPAIKKAALKAQKAGVDVGAIYEVTLQSYLFLGFPRMLTGAECFQETFPDFARKLQGKAVTPSQIGGWLAKGTKLCREVYAGNFDKLHTRVNQFSPEIFQWMILEGYGKVLSRPGLGIRNRELAIVASLMADNRTKQLFSHIRGALNVGVSVRTLETVIKDIATFCGAESETALSFLVRLGHNV